MLIKNIKNILTYKVNNYNKYRNNEVYNYAMFGSIPYIWNTNIIFITYCHPIPYIVWTSNRMFPEPYGIEHIFLKPYRI